MVSFVLKVFVLSLMGAIAIKYGGPFLPISPSATNALIAVCFPSLLMATLFLWRWQQSPQKKQESEM